MLSLESLILRRHEHSWVVVPIIRHCHRGLDALLLMGPFGVQGLEELPGPTHGTTVLEYEGVDDYYNKSKISA